MARHRSFTRHPLLVSSLSLLVMLTVPVAAQAMPTFARQYKLSCNVCHAAYPRLNAFGEQFIANNFRLANWKEQLAAPIQDDMLALPKSVPLAVRAQAYVQAREGKAIDPDTGETVADSGADFQAPYLIKLLSSAPLSDHITYYFYGIFAEKGGNGETLIEDAWFRHDDSFGTGIGTQLGQFQMSDLMFPRETRLTFQDFMVYRMAGVTYDRGVLFDRGFGPLDLAVGAMNGNGIRDNYTVNSPGYQRADHMFDNDTRKSVFGRLGLDLGPVAIGLFGLGGEQLSEDESRLTEKRVAGVDVSGQIGARVYWFGQYLWNRWGDFIDVGQDYDWAGGFAGIDYVHSDRWTWSLLYNYNDAGDLDETGTVFEGINMNTATLAASYYFMRNLKGIIEFTYDFQKEDDKYDGDSVGHETKEGYVLMGFDTAF